tara:strand:+ start:109 stop:1377 length:1269 start_codon:yes stop_codon:yes gene_type:complete
MAFGKNSGKEILDRLVNEGKAQLSGQEQPQRQEINEMKVEKQESSQPESQENPVEVVSEQPQEKQESSLNNETTETVETKEAPKGDEFGSIVDLNESVKTESAQAEQKSFNDQDIVSYMNEKFGKSFESVEDIKFNEAVEVDPLSETSAAAKSLDEYLKATGKTPLDWLNAQVIDYEKFSPEQAIVSTLVNDGYSQEDAIEVYKAKYAGEEIDEDLMTDGEVAAAKQRNRLKEIEREAEGRRAKSKLLEMKEKFGAPIEGWKPIIQETKNEFTQEVKDAFKNSASEAMENLKTVDIPIQDNKVYRVSMEEYMNTNKETFSDPEKLLQRFKSEDGSFDATKLIQAAMLLDKQSDMTSYAVRNAFQMGQQNQQSVGRNLNFDKADPTRGNYSSDSEEVQKQKRQLADVLSKSGRGSKMSIKLKR